MIADIRQFKIPKFITAIMLSFSFINFTGCVKKTVNTGIVNTKIYRCFPTPKGKIEVLAFSLVNKDSTITLPEVIGGLDSLVTKMIYPEIASRAGVEGIVVCEFIVDESGNAKQWKLIRGIGAGCDEEVRDVVKKAKFIPANKKGKSIDCAVRIRFKFILVYI